MFCFTALLLTSFNPEISWLPNLAEFMNMVVTMFWWMLAAVIAVIPLAVIVLIVLLILMVAGA